MLVASTRSPSLLAEFPSFRRNRRVDEEDPSRVNGILTRAFRENPFAYGATSSSSSGISFRSSLYD